MHPNRRFRLGRPRGDARLRRRGRLLHDLRRRARRAARRRTCRSSSTRRTGCASTSSRAQPRRAGARRRARARSSCIGPDAYVSPDWYGTRRPGADLELCRGRGEGPAPAARRRRSWPTCSTALSAVHEARLAPKPRLDPRQDEPGPVRRRCSRRSSASRCGSRRCAAPASSARTRAKPRSAAPSAGLEAIGHVRRWPALMRAAAAA